MRPTQAQLLAVVCTLGLLTSSIAQAADDQPKDKKLTFGGGMMAFVGAGFIDKPADRTYTTSSGAQAKDEIYPGFGGGSYGGGLILEGRFIGIIGLEIDIIRSSDRGRGDVTLNGKKSTIELGQSAWHVPMLIKASVPISPFVRPNIFAGPEFVFPSDPSASANPPIAPTLAAKVDNYIMITGGLGFEFKLPIDELDIRIPLSFRGSYHSVGSTVGDRVTYANNNTHWILSTGWKYQTQATLGATVFF